MNDKRPKILVLGATGQVGRGVVSLLSENDAVEAIAAARTPSKAVGLDVPVRQSSRRILPAIAESRFLISAPMD